MTEETKPANATGKPTLQHEEERGGQTRQNWVATYAYFLAEARGFTPVNALDDWIKAERAYMEEGMAKGESD
jgi:hypothetical protein